jgi:hypothetical protein
LFRKHVELEKDFFGKIVDVVKNSFDEVKEFVELESFSYTTDAGVKLEYQPKKAITDLYLAREFTLNKFYTRSVFDVLESSVEYRARVFDNIRD